MSSRKTDFAIPEESSSHKKIGKSLGKTTSSFFDIFADEEEEKPDFRNPANRKRFVSVVFAIITIQLMLTVVCTVPFDMKEEAKQIVLEKSWLIWVFLMILVVPYFMLVCCESTRREFPTNIVLLFFLTIGMAGTCACCSAWFETVAVLYTFVLIVFVTVFITIVACASKRDFTNYKWIAIIMMVFLILFAIVAVILATTTRYDFNTFIYPGILVAIFTAFLLHDANAIMGGNRLAHITPKDYICGAAQVYVDVVGIFWWFLETVGTPTDTD